MIAMLLATQAATAEPLPEEAANTVAQVAAAVPPESHFNILQLILHASIPVQLVMLLLLGASIA